VFEQGRAVRTSVKIAVAVIVVFLFFFLIIPAFSLTAFRGHYREPPFNVSNNSTTNATTSFYNYTNYTMMRGARGGALQGYLRGLMNEINAIRSIL
jgi:hypothetical protein